MIRGGDFYKWCKIFGVQVGTGKPGAKSIAFSVRMGSAQTLASNSTFPVHFDSIDYDRPGGYFNTGSHQYVPQEPGVYNFIAQLGVSIPSSTGGQIRASLLIGDLLVAITPYIPLVSGQVVNIPLVAQNVQLNGTTDYAQVFIQLNGYAGTDMAMDTAFYTTFFQGFLVK